MLVSARSELPPGLDMIMMDDPTTSAPNTSPDLPEKEVLRLQALLAKCGLQHLLQLFLQEKVGYIL